MNQKDDSDLRIVFQELRRQQEYSVPSFKKLWNHQQHTYKQKTFWRLAMTFSLGLTAVLITYFTARELPPVPSMHTQVQSISKWKAPTDFLLQTPGVEILTSMPALASPIPNYQLPLQQKGVQR